MICISYIVTLTIYKKLFSIHKHNIAITMVLSHYQIPIW